MPEFTITEVIFWIIVGIVWSIALWVAHRIMKEIRRIRKRPLSCPRCGVKAGYNYHFAEGFGCDTCGYFEME